MVEAKNIHSKHYLEYITIVFFLLIICSVPIRSYAQNKSKLKTFDDSLQYDYTVQTFEDTFIDANLLKNNDDYTEALLTYKKCLKINPKSAAVYYEMAQIYLSLSRYIDVENAIKKAIKYNPGNVEYYLFLAKHYKLSKQKEKEKEVYKFITKQYPNNTEAAYSYLDLCIDLGENVEALGFIQTIENSFGISEKLLIEKARIYAGLENRDKTIETLQYLIDEYPNNEDNYYLLAETYTILHMYAEALGIYNRIIKNEANASEAILKKVEIFIKQDQPDSLLNALLLVFDSPYISQNKKSECINDFTKEIKSDSEVNKHYHQILLELIKRFPTDPELNYEVATYFLSTDSLMEQGIPYMYKSLKYGKYTLQLYKQLVSLEVINEQWDSVVSICESAYEKYPYKNTFALYLAEAYANTNQPIRAIPLLLDINAYNKTLKSKIRSEMAYAYFKLDSLDKALELLNEAANLDSTNYNFRQKSATIYAYLGKRPGYVTYLVNKCIELNKLDVRNQKILAVQNFVLGNYKDAQLLQQAIVIDNPTNNNLEFLGDILFKNGNIEEANEVWKRAVENGANIDIQRKKLLLQDN